MFALQYDFSVTHVLLNLAPKICAHLGIKKYTCWENFFKQSKVLQYAILLHCLTSLILATIIITTLPPSFSSPPFEDTAFRAVPIFLY